MLAVRATKSESPLRGSTAQNNVRQSGERGAMWVMRRAIQAQALVENARPADCAAEVHSEGNLILLLQSSIVFAVTAGKIRSHRQRNMHAAAIAAKQLEGMDHPGFMRRYRVCVSRMLVLAMSMLAAGMDAFIFGAVAALGSKIDAARAIPGNAQVNGTAVPRQELHRHQQQVEQHSAHAIRSPR